MVKRTSKPEATPCSDILDSEWINASVMLGSPHKDCGGSGICKVSAPVSDAYFQSSPLHCKEVRASIEVRAGDRVVFHFLRAGMCAAAARKYFSGGSFVVESPCVFQPDHWPDERYVVIHPGVYPVQRGRAYWTVEF